MRVEIDLLGGFAVRVDGRVVPAAEWRRRQAAALTKLLALAPRRTLHREQVIDALWPHTPMEDAAPRLHKAAYFARRSLGDPRALVLDGNTVSLFPDAEVIIDAEVFERRAQQALAADGRSRNDSDGFSAAATTAELWTGDLLPEDPYEPWLEAPRDRLRQLHHEVLRRAGRWSDLARAEPSDEEANLAEARRLAENGDRSGALRQLERLERALRAGLGVTPGPAAVSLRAELLGLDSPHASAQRRPPPPLGRDAELGRIDRLIASASAGQGRTLFVSGPAGIGKTTLLRWLEQRAEERGLRVGVGTAAAIEGAWPYAPVLEALADLCRRYPALLDGVPDEYRVEIEGALRGTSPEWTGESRHQRLFVSVAELLRLASSGGGAVLIVDDAHDADEASMRLLHYLSRLAVGERLVIVVAHRPWPLRPPMEAMRRSLIGRGTSVPLDLGPLADADIRRLVRRAVRDDEVLLEHVVKLSGGNPFAAVELARTAGAADDRTSPIGTLVLRGLGREASAALTRVAVLGAAFDTDEYVALSGVGQERAYALLDEALATGVVERTGPGYRFRHSLVRDALLDGLPPHRLLPLHRHAAKVLRDLDASPARIGHQLLQAGDVRAAAPFLLRAARAAAAIGAYRDTLALIDTVRDDVPDLERGPMLALRADMLLATGDAGAVVPTGGSRLDTRRGRAAATAAAARPSRDVRCRLYGRC